jgi:Icc-related predicted phosphoesterase
MELWTQYLVESQTISELISALENTIAAVDLSDVLAVELAEISEISPNEISEEELEDSIRKSIELLLKEYHELSIETVMQICNVHKMTAQKLIDDGLIVRWNNEFYQEK